MLDSFKKESEKMRFFQFTGHNPKVASSNLATAITNPMSY